MKNRNGKHILLVLFLLSAFLFVVYGTVQVGKAMDTDTKNEKETEPTETEIGIGATEIGLGVYAEEDYVYILCEVIETNPETFTALLPNGELHEFYMIEDYPIDDNGNPYFELVCFKTENQDDYTTYKVVAVR